MNAKTSNKGENSQPQPETQNIEVLPDDAVISEAEAQNVVTLAKAKGKRRNAWETEEVEITETAQNKVQLVSEIKQRLAEASDAAGAEDKTSEALQEALDKAARRMIEGRITGLLSADEVTGLLGGTFGFKTKKNGEPSATPDGQGEGVRKRIVRVVNAAQWLANDGQVDDAFFRNIPADAIVDPDHNTTAKAAVADLITSVRNGPDNGGMTIWNAYLLFGKVKTAAQPSRTVLAFDAKRIRGLADTLTGDIAEAGETVATSAALRNSYSALRKAIEMLGEAIAEYEDEHSEAA